MIVDATGGSSRHTPQEIITTLREAEVPLANGRTVREVIRELGTSEQTYCRRRGAVYIALVAGTNVTILRRG